MDERRKSGYSFGFEGSPGIGKTSLNKGLTKCLMDSNNNSRPFNFIAIGGSSNGSFLEGHGYTYMNSTGEKYRHIDGFKMYEPNYICR